ncbi:MAG: acetyl-CoA carboxylase biotin carboxyl carrier protein subunit, partial [bacterium]|nr:acetyl-CoA carboxylase biotin carboxyl carrier protein subunit [bacterium]
LNMKYLSTIGDNEYEIILTQTEDGHFTAELNNEILPLQILKTDGQHTLTALIGNRPYELEIRKNQTDYLIHYHGGDFKIRVEDERLLLLKKHTQLVSPGEQFKEIIAPMPGLVVSIDVSVGQKIKTGQGLLVFEAMKMENEIRAPFDGVVKEIFVSEKAPVEKGQKLILLE